jgi:hypothetical protein
MLCFVETYGDAQNTSAPNSPQSGMKNNLPKLTMRDLFWAMAFAAVLCWAVRYQFALQQEQNQLKREWRRLRLHKAEVKEYLEQEEQFLDEQRQQWRERHRELTERLDMVREVPRKEQ